MANRELLEKLLKIAENQQKVITKLAQNLQSLNPNQTPHDDSLIRDKDAEVILAALPPAVKVAVRNLEVGRSSDPAFEKEVRVFFNPGKASDAAFQGVQNTIHKLQLSNLLAAQSYALKEMA